MKSDIEFSKKAAAEKAAEFVRDGMVVGLGTGSTAEYFLKKLADEKKDIIGIPTSDRTRDLAGDLGVKTASLADYPSIDVDVDGADEIDPDFNLIKGGGGAHTSEKRVAEHSKLFIVIADYSKLVERLGTFPVAVEFEPPHQSHVEARLTALGGRPELRGGFVSDRGNLVFDTYFEVRDPLMLEENINKIEGVVENGVFAKRRPEIVIIGEGSELKVLRR